MEQSYTPIPLLSNNVDNDTNLYHLKWQVEHSFSDILSLLYLLQFDVRSEVTERLFRQIKES